MPPRLRVIEATIAELAPGGDAVAVETIGGERRAIFVPGALPNERVRIEADVAQRPARGRLLAVLERSAERVTPACPHAERCGGCDWMHLAEEAQAREHARLVARLLPSSFAAVEVRTHRAPKSRAYRTRARVHIDATKGAPVVGMFAKRTHSPTPVDACLVLDPILDAARGRLAALLEGARGRGEAHLSLGATTKEGTPRHPRPFVLELRWSGDLPGAVFARLEEGVKNGWLGGARVFAGAVKVPATIGDPTPFIRGADGVPLRLAPGGFSQASEEANALLAKHVEAIAQNHPGDAVELYAGAGNLTVLLARDRKLVAVESDRDACEAMRANLAARSVEAKVVCADASTFAIPPKTKLVVLDPPRTGAKAACELLGTQKGELAVLYVSCDPPTLGRDLGILERSGYRLVSLDTFEMFPQTSHVESVALLVRSRKT